MPLWPILFFALVAGYHSQYCDKHPGAKGEGVRAVDFCNFTYPGVKSSRHKRLWPEPSFKLKKGVHPPESQDGGGLILLEEVQYGDVTRDGHENAVTTLIWFSGGTMHLGLVYVWSLKGPAPSLLWNFVGGDRGFGGLRRAYADSGDLLLEIYDPNAAVGNCCSRRIIRTRYRWDGKKFVAHGKPKTLPNPDYKVLPDENR